jgi:hypothetical protein
MGSYQTYQCDCGYVAEMLNGGLGFGESVAVHTIVCHDCKRLMDVLVSDDPGHVDPYGEHRAFYCFNKEVKCSRARTRRHRISLWTHPGPCPRCGKTMTEHDSGAVWD